MAELNTGDGGGKDGKVRSKKSNSKVDLTAMVDLAFLLITFFMLTTSLSKPQSMDLGMPEKDPKNPELNIEVADDRTMTVLLGDKGEVQWYMGQFTEPLEAPVQTTYGKSGIREKILEKVVSVPKKYGDPKKGLIIIIKPSKKSTYKNLIDILDEMAICRVKTYAIVDISPEEVALLDKE